MYIFCKNNTVIIWEIDNDIRRRIHDGLLEVWRDGEFYVRPDISEDTVIEIIEEIQWEYE